MALSYGGVKSFKVLVECPFLLMVLSSLLSRSS